MLFSAFSIDVTLRKEQISAEGVGSSDSSPSPAKTKKPHLKKPSSSGTFLFALDGSSRTLFSS
jgi:hypothetical protein